MHKPSAHGTSGFFVFFSLSFEGLVTQSAMKLRLRKQRSLQASAHYTLPYSSEGFYIRHFAHLSETKEIGGRGGEGIQPELGFEPATSLDPDFNVLTPWPISLGGGEGMRDDSAEIPY